MTHWKKLFSKHLVATANAVNANFKHNNISQLIQIPKAFHSEEQMIKFSNEINNCIRFPHLRYLEKNAPIKH